MRTVVVALVVAVGIVVGAPPAQAKGAMLDPVQDRYEPGDTATMIGYTSGLPGSPDPRDPAVHGQFQGYLVSGGELVEPWSDHDGDGFVPTGIPLGPPQVQDTQRTDFPPVRVSITFTIPDDLEPGTYHVILAEPSGSALLGDITGGLVHIGVDPSYPVSRTWPLDEPAIAELADGARVWDIQTGNQVTAAQIRAGDIPPPTPPPPPPAPERQRQPQPRPAAQSAEQPPAEVAAARPGPATDAGRGAPGWLPWLVGVALVAAGAAATRTVHRTARSAEVVGVPSGPAR